MSITRLGKRFAIVHSDYGNVRLWFWHLLLCLPAAGCQSGKQVASPDNWLPEVDFADAFEQVAIVELEQPPDYPLVAITGVAAAEDGTLAVTDGPEGLVKIYEDDGRLRSIIGRKGQGPAEFNFPLSPQWSNGGVLYISDMASRRLTVIDSTGLLVRTIPLNHVSVATRIQVLAPDRILVSGMHNSQKSIAVVVNEAGVIDSSFARVDLTNFRPRGEDDSPLWISTRGASSLVRGDTLFTVLTIADSIWKTDLRTQETRATALRVPGYIAPVLPPPGPPDRKQTIAWASSFSRASDIFATEQFLFVPYVVGMINADGVVSGVMHTSNEEWRGLRNVPAVIGQTATGLIALLPSEDGTMVLGFYEPRI